MNSRMTSRFRVSGEPSLPVVAFVWETFSPYHVDRCEALERGLGDVRKVVGIEITSSQDEYEWQPTEGTGDFNRITLFSGTLRSQTRWPQRFWRLVRTLTKLKAKEVFLCNYETPEIFFCAVWLRILGRKTYSMLDSKFDDKPRYLLRELAKCLPLAPYSGALVSGSRAEDYARLLGFRRRPIALGYNTLSIERIQRNALAGPAPAGAEFSQRHFIVISRFIHEKNLFVLLDAYRLYREQVDSPRDLSICGSGVLEGDLRKKVEQDGIDGIRWEGFLQEKAIATQLSTSLALILPSVSETWGNVVNEAFALGVPVICSTAVGARDSLVRTAVNGYIVEPDNAAGLAAFMCQLHRDPETWRRLAQGAAASSDKADVRHLVAATRQLIGLPDP
jgi:glycosyltransferase involved in cell wall biosynthesis